MSQEDFENAVVRQISRPTMITLVSDVESGYLEAVVQTWYGTVYIIRFGYDRSSRLEYCYKGYKYAFTFWKTYSNRYLITLANRFARDTVEREQGNG